MKNADLAVHAAKSGGKNRVILCSDKMKDRIVENTMLTNRMFRALEKEEFFIEYQPQFSCAFGQITGAEALLRWRPADINGVGPGRFIPILEQTGLMHEVGIWVFKTVLKEHARLLRVGLPPFRFSINISIAQFRKDKFVDTVARLIKDSGVDPKYIELEITESIAFMEPAYVLDSLKKLKRLGLEIAIDDFGTGYSSLDRLTKMPVDKIKIDKNFIEGIGKNKKEENMVRIIVYFSKMLGVKVIAEGVETKEQADFLRNIHCDEIQGYYYSKPMAFDKLEAMLSADKFVRRT